MLKIPRRVAILSLGATALLAAAPPSFAQSALDAIGKAGRVRIGIPVDFPPWGSLGPDNAPRGLDIDVAQLVAEALKVKAELVPIASAQRLPWLQERKVDLVISTLGKTAEREKLIDFTEGYGSFFLMVYGPKNVALSTPAELKGKTVAVSRGTVEDGELTKLEGTGVQIMRMEGNMATLKAYVEGKTQLLATGTSVAAALGVTNPELDLAPKITLKEQLVHVGVTKGEDALRARVNEIIAAARADGRLRKLNAKWFSRAGLGG